MDTKGRNVIIDFTEKEESTYKPPGELAKLKVMGDVKVINPSESNRLWNTVLFLKGLEMVMADIAADMKIGEISPKAQWSKPYEVKNEEIQTKTSLKITEKIDTYYEKGTEINWALVKDHQMPTSFTISLENTTNSTITKIKLVKNLPEIFGSPLIDPPAQGDLEFNEGTRTITWKDFSLVPGGVQSIVIRVGFCPTQTEPIPTGNIEVDYIVPGLIRSKLTGTVNSQAEVMFAIDQAESLEPGEWECTAEFDNMSDFLVELKTVRVEQVTENRKELVLEESPHNKIAPDSSWSKDFTVKSGVVPKFASVHEFIVVPVINTKIIGHILYEAGVLPVAAISSEKIIDPPAVRAYTKTPMNISLIVTNAGSAILNELVLRDVIPRDHKPPELNDITVSIGDQELRSGIIRELDPKDQNPEIAHNLVVKIENLASAGGFRPEDQILVSYPLQSWEPKPKEEYPCPLDVTANVSPPGPPVKIPKIETKIEVQYVRRRISAKKGQTPGAEPGEYIIPIVFENKGEVLIENITIMDIIPSNFNLLDWNPKEFKPDTQDAPKGIKLTWKIPKADPGEKIKFSYTIKGSGEYTREELEVVVG